jgi:hypothetical protein
MQKLLVLTTVSCLSYTGSIAQKSKQVSVAITDQASAYPFGKFVGFVNEPVHPGIEFAYTILFREKKKHEWYYEFKAGYFFHRFVQHGIPLYFNFGYRYKVSKAWSFDASLGAGYFHSIAATEVLKQNDAGDYENAKGIGRAQAMAAFTLGAGYKIPLQASKFMRLFFQYQQRIQMPFINSYVPVLPYNQIALGAAMPVSIFKPSK